MKRNLNQFKTDVFSSEEEGRQECLPHDTCGADIPVCSDSRALGTRLQGDGSSVGAIRDRADSCCVPFALFCGDKKRVPDRITGFQGCLFHGGINPVNQHASPIKTPSLLPLLLCGSLSSRIKRSLINRIKILSILNIPSKTPSMFTVCPFKMTKSQINSRAGFSLIEVMVSAVLAIIVVWAAGTQIINVMRYHNEFRIDAILLEDLTRVANGVQSRVEMCTSWVETPPNSGIWKGTFPIQVNGVAFETNRFTNVTGYRIFAEDGAFVEELIRNPSGGVVTNTVTRFIANEPGFSSVSNNILFTDQGSGLYQVEFNTIAEWRWAGRTYTNSATVPRIIVLYNKN